MIGKTKGFFVTFFTADKLMEKVAAAFLPPLYQLILRLFTGTYFSNHVSLYLFKVVFARYDRRILVYGYKPDTLIAVYQALQGTDTPRVCILKKAAVYLADWLVENHYHCLKVRLVLQQPQMVQRAELVRLASYAQSSV